VCVYCGGGEDINDSPTHSESVCEEAFKALSPAAQALLKVLSVSCSRKEINNYANKPDVLAKYLPYYNSNKSIEEMLIDD
jgi:hypothetical protein